MVPRHPDELVLFTLVFNLPHILASHILYFDRDYAARYAKRLAWTSVVLIVLTIVVLAVAGLAFDTFLGLLLTVYHVIAQQIGMTRAQLGRVGYAYPIWKVSAVLLALTVYLPIQAPIVLGWNVMGASFLGAAVLLPTTLVCAIVLTRAAATTTGRSYLWSNQLMLMSMPILAGLGYPFFALLMPRFVHDLSAFYVYGVHDANRNRHERPNLLYGAPGLRRLPTYVVGPAAALLAAFAVSRLPWWPAAAITSLASGLHYYMEGVTWKRGTIHRRYMSFR
jgi:hypothetical protein